MQGGPGWLHCTADRSKTWSLPCRRQTCQQCDSFNVCSDWCRNKTLRGSWPRRASRILMQELRGDHKQCADRIRCVFRMVIVEQSEVWARWERLMIGCDNCSLELQPQTSAGGRKEEEVFLLTEMRWHLNFVFKHAEMKGRASCGYITMNKRGKIQLIWGVARLTDWLNSRLCERESWEFGLIHWVASHKQRESAEGFLMDWHNHSLRNIISQ